MPTSGAVRLLALQKAIENILNWAQVRFDKVCVFALVRGNSLDQAISRAVAKTTDIWHRNQAAVQENDPYEGINLKTNVLNTEILDALPSVVRQSQVIRRVAKNRPEICRLVRYEDMVGSVEDSSQVLVEHAVALGFQPEQKVAQRNLVKLIKEDHSAQIKESFRQFLQKHLGDELWQT